ncbi:extracellular solute-binding protein [Halosimplex aquaticum]
MVDEDNGERDRITRRNVVKSAGALGAVGALGSLAGCTGDGGDGDSTTGGDGGASGDGGDGGDSTEDSGDGGGGDTETDSGSMESVTISFWSGDAAESSETRSWFQESMKNYQNKHTNVTVDLQPISYGDMGSKLTSAVQAGNSPDMAQGGTTALQFYFNDKLADHGTFIEGTDGLPDNWTQSNIDAAQYRGNWWAGGSPRHTYTMLGINANMFREAGVSGPEELETWTGFRRAVKKVQEQFPDAWAYEETGTPGDLETYWGQARTSYTDGTDPWFDGNGDEATLKVGETDRTDGMIKNTIDMANTFSSSKSASRGDENMPQLLLTQRAASYTYAVGNAPKYRSVKSDVSFGWDGDIWQGPIPKLDANYGEEFGIDELPARRASTAPTPGASSSKSRCSPGATTPRRRGTC